MAVSFNKSGIISATMMNIPVEQMPIDTDKKSIIQGSDGLSNHGFIETGNLMRVYDGRIETTEFIEY